jgi:ribonuclease Z
VEQFVKTSLDLSATYITYSLKFIELATGASVDLGTIDGLRVHAHPLQHKVPCFGFVVVEPDKPGQLDAKTASARGARGAELGKLKAGQDVTLADGTVLRAADLLSAPAPGRKGVFLGDTANSDTCLATGSDCHILVHECTYDASLEQKAIEGGHSTSRMAGRFAHAIRAKHIILTHFSQRYDKADKPTLDAIDIDQLVQECVQECTCKVTAASDLAVYNI